MDTNTLKKRSLRVYRRVKQGLGAAAGLVLAAPLKLPSKVRQGAHYVALLIGLLDALEREKPDSPKAEGTEGDAP